DGAGGLRPGGQGPGGRALGAQLAPAARRPGRSPARVRGRAHPPLHERGHRLFPDGGAGLGPVQAGQGARRAGPLRAVRSAGRSGRTGRPGLDARGAARDARARPGNLPRPRSMALATAAGSVRDPRAAAHLGRLGAFMLDGARGDHSVLPLYETFVRHSCLSAYFRADELARAEEPDLYQPALYTGDAGLFHQEIYEYAPPFLLLPRLL